MCKLKSLFLIALLCVAVGASAQLSFGVKAGLNMSNITDFENSEMKIGYKIGPTVEYAFAPNMAIQSGVLLSSLGTKEKDGDGSIDANYLQIPISFAYKYAIAPDTKIYGNVGPYFGFGIFGKSKFYNELTDKYEKEDTFGDNGMENFDCGLTFGVGMEVTKFNFGLNYDLGLTKVYDVSGSSSRNSNFWISVGYNF